VRQQPPVKHSTGQAKPVKLLAKDDTCVDTRSLSPFVKYWLKDLDSCRKSNRQNFKTVSFQGTFIPRDKFQ